MRPGQPGSGPRAWPAKACWGLPRVKITEAEAAGETPDYPVPVPEFAPLKVRYYFGDDFDIKVMRRGGGLGFFLYPKDNP